MTRLRVCAAMTRRAIAVAAVTVLLVVGVGVPAHAASEQRAILGGAALSSATVALAAVNPNFDLWPVYSFSEMDNAASHTLSAGVWPGFLIDAFFWLYKFQPVERGALGVAESLWPNAPHTAEASSSRYATSNTSDLCGFALGANPAAEAACRTVWDPFVAGNSLRGGTAHASSAETKADGAAQGAGLSLPGGIEVAGVHSGSSTSAADARTAVSEATQRVKEIRIGTSLVIESIEARAVARANGGANGASALSVLTLGRVTFNGQAATIDDRGVHVMADEGASSANAILAAQGFDVRLFQGRDDAAQDGTAATASSGGLVVRVARDRIPEPLPAQNAAACAAIAASPINQELLRVSRDVDNPLYGVVPFVPMDKTFHVDESVPPVVPCPYVDRSTDVGIVLGTAAAGATSNLLPPEPEPVDRRIGATPDRVTFDTIAVPGPPTIEEPAPVAPRATSPGPTVVVRSPRLVRKALAHAVADTVKLLYGAMWIALVMIVIGRFSFRSLMRS